LTKSKKFIKNKEIIEIMLKLDHFDKEILQELEKDASTPLHVLAKKIKRSKQFVSFRLKRLENEGVILGYTAIVDMLSLGYFTFRIYLDFKNMTEDKKKEFAKKMEKYPQIIRILLINGSWDMALFVLVKDIVEFREFWDVILEEHRENIKDHTVFIYAPIHNFNKVFIEGHTNRVERVFGASHEKKMKKLDIKMVLEYAKNVRQPLIQLAKKVKHAPVTVKKQIKELEKNKAIVGYNLILDPRKIGFKKYKVALFLNSLKRKRELFIYCKEHPNIYQVNRIVGGVDLEVLVMVESKRKLLEIIDLIKNKFKDDISDDKYFEFVTLYSEGILPS
jgi:DNA-binding Lrp family transcriptional regulator